MIENGHRESEYPELRIIDEEAFGEAQEIRKSKAGLSPALKERKAEIYSVVIVGRSWMTE